MPAIPERMSAEVREVAGNWKQHAANYLDQFQSVLSTARRVGSRMRSICGSYTTELYDRSVLQWVYARDPADGFDPAWLPERFADPKGRRVFALWWFVFPNLTLNFYPWGLSVNIYSPVPDRPDATKFTWYQLALDRAKHAERDRRWLSSQVDAEDVDALAQVARGLRRGSRRGASSRRSKSAAFTGFIASCRGRLREASGDDGGARVARRERRVRAPPLHVGTARRDARVG